MKTKKRAKELSLEVWDYLRDHPEIDKKEDLPLDLYDNVIHLFHACPLCEYYYYKTISLIIMCKECPLCNCYDGDSIFQLWHAAESSEDRAKYAGLIYDKIAAWDIDND